MVVCSIPNFVNIGRQVGSIGWVNKQSTYLRCLWLQLVSLYNFSVSFKQSVIGRHRYAEIKISFFVSFSAIAYRLLYLYLFYFISPSLASAQYDQIARLFIYSLGIYNIQYVPKITLNMPTRAKKYANYLMNSFKMDTVFYHCAILEKFRQIWSHSLCSASNEKIAEEEEKEKLA